MIAGVKIAVGDKAGTLCQHVPPLLGDVDILRHTYFGFLKAPYPRDVINCHGMNAILLYFNTQIPFPPPAQMQQTQIFIAFSFELQTLPDATPPLGKILPFIKIAVTFDPIELFRCTSRFIFS